MGAARPGPARPVPRVLPSRSPSRRRRWLKGTGTHSLRPRQAPRRSYRPLARTSPGRDHPHPDRNLTCPDPSLLPTPTPTRTSPGRAPPPASPRPAASAASQRGARGGGGHRGSWGPPPARPPRPGSPRVAVPAPGPLPLRPHIPHVAREPQRVTRAPAPLTCPARPGARGCRARRVPRAPRRAAPPAVPSVPAASASGAGPSAAAPAAAAPAPRRSRLRTAPRPAPPAGGSGEEGPGLRGKGLGRGPPRRPGQRPGSWGPGAPSRSPAGPGSPRAPQRLGRPGPLHSPLRAPIRSRCPAVLAPLGPGGSGTCRPPRAGWRPPPSWAGLPGRVRERPELQPPAQPVRSSRPGGVGGAFLDGELCGVRRAVGPQQLGASPSPPGRLRPAFGEGAPRPPDPTPRSQVPSLRDGSGIPPQCDRLEALTTALSCPARKTRREQVAASEPANRARG